jgi:uncharacterized phage infection (PIP) family protein YhgE
MLYRHPGEHEIHGDKFDYVIVEEDDVEEYLDAGWFETTGEALENSGAPSADPRDPSELSQDDDQSSEDDDDDDDNSDAPTDELLKAAADKIEELEAQQTKDAESSKELSEKLEASEARVAELEKAAAESGEPTSNEDAAANRAFMELIANYLDIPFNPQIGDAKLRDRLIAAINDGDGEGEDGVE